MSDEDSNLSKRERQKLRRQRRLEQEATHTRAARRRRLVSIGVIVVLALGVIGFFVQRQVAERAAAAERRENVAARLDELGCEPIEEIPDAGAGHVPAAQLAANPPDVLYEDRPATSGAHLGQVSVSGVFDKAIDERLTTHNLEHGYVNFWYAGDADAEEVTELKEFAREQIGDGQEKIIVAEYPGELPEDVNFSIVAWNFRQNCAEFDPDVALTFMDDHYGLAGRAPEKNLSAHTGDGQGVYDPDAEEGPLLFPPLTDAAATGSDAADATEPAASPTDTP